MAKIMVANPSGRSAVITATPTPQLLEVLLDGKFRLENTLGFTLWHDPDAWTRNARPNLPAEEFYYHWTGDIKSFYGPVVLSGRSPHGVVMDVEEEYVLSLEDHCRNHRHMSH